MAQNYRNQSGRSEGWRGEPYQPGPDRDRPRFGSEQRSDSDWDDRNRGSARSPASDRYASGGYSEEFGQRRNRNRDDDNDRELGSRYYGSRGSSGANYQSGRSYGDYDREGQSRFDEGRFDEGNRFEASDDRDYGSRNYGNRDYGDAEFTLARDRGTSTSRWQPDENDSGGYFGTGSYIDEGDSWRGFGRDFERARARAQQERDFGSFRDRGRETSGDYGSYGRSDYGSQGSFGRGREQDRPWQSQPRGYEDRSSWNYDSGGRRAESGSAHGAFGRDYSAVSNYGSSAGQSFRGRGPQGYQRSDERLKEMICERLTDDPAIDASEVTVEVTGQVVKLTGTVEDRSTKYEIEELIENFGGVKDIDNQLRVQRSASSSERSSDAQTEQGRGTAGASSAAATSGRTSGSGAGTTSGGSPNAGSTARKS